MARKTAQSHYVESIDLDTLLFGNPTWEQVADFFRYGDFNEEHYLVAAIKKHLLTDAQRALLHQNDWSIEDLLNGRVEGGSEPYEAIFAEWNDRLGFHQFGF